MKENSIEEDIKIVENYLANSAINETDSNFFKNGGWETVDLEIPKSMQHILSDYKSVLKENEKYKRIAEINLNDAEEFKNNMCEHRCLLKSENKEQKELIEKMKAFLLKENKMCDFLESEE